MSRPHTITCTHVEHDDIVLADLGDAVEHRDDPALEPLRGRVRVKTRQGRSFRRRDHPVADARLQSVLDATDWFIDPQVRVEEGVVFLNGQAESDELKKWAGDLARNTQDVVAVANRLEVPELSVWDFRLAWSGLLVLCRSSVCGLELTH